MSKLQNRQHIEIELDMDTACVELKFTDGSMISIDTIAVENEIADNMYERSELDYLIYDDPAAYVADYLNNLYLFRKGLVFSNLQAYNIENKTQGSL